MKQSPATSRFPTLIVVLLLVTSWLTACSRLDAGYSSGTTAVESLTAEKNPGSVNLNTASISELEGLPGVGPALAERIVAFREANGRFRRAEHLMMVRGISDRKFRELRPLIKVE
jgi:competence ComEA-like helix-hairpin-helix protein